MSDIPEFLPALANTNGNWDTVCGTLYLVYTTDFCTGTVEHDGKRLIRNSRILEDGAGKEEAFWHLITGDDKTAGERVFDPPRAARLPWAKPMIASAMRPELEVFDYEEGSGKTRRYIWLKDHDYVVVLEHRGGRFFLVTAFFIDYKGKRKQLERRARNAQK